MAELEEQIKELENKLTGDMFKDMEIRDKIHNLTMTIHGTRPVDSAVECVGCGS